MSPPFSPRSVSHRSHPISYNSDSPLSASLYAHKVAPSPPSHDTCVFSTLAWSLSPRAPDRAVQMLSLPECPGSSHRIAYISLRQTRCSRSCLNQRSSPKTHLKLSSPQPLEKYPTIPSMRSTKRTPLKSCLLYLKKLCLTQSPPGKTIASTTHDSPNILSQPTSRQ